MKNIKQNIQYIDYFKALLMILVILGHINYANQAIKAWIYAFHMPAFFYASGLLLKNRPVPNIRDGAFLLWKRFRVLIFPYFIWALLYASFSDSNLVRIIYGSHQSLASAKTLTSLWFLPVLFEAIALFFLAQLVFKEKLTFLVKLLLAAVSFAIAAFLPPLRHGYPWCSNVSFAAFGFLLLGNLLYPTIQQAQKKAVISKKCVVVWLLVAVIGLAGSFLYLLNLPKGGFILMANAKYGNFLLFILTACFGTAFAISLSILLDKIRSKCEPGKLDWLSFLGQNTLCAFVVQKPIIRWFKNIFKFIPAPQVVALLVTCAGTVIGCCLMAMFINRYFPAMVGKIPQRELENLDK